MREVSNGLLFTLTQYHKSQNLTTHRKLIPRCCIDGYHWKEDGHRKKMTPERRWLLRENGNGKRTAMKIRRGQEYEDVSEKPFYPAIALLDIR
jgi:hypothetical protein